MKKEKSKKQTMISFLTLKISVAVMDALRTRDSVIGNAENHAVSKYAGLKHIVTDK